MNLPIDSDIQRIIEEKLRSGRYATVEDLLHAGLAALEQQEAFGEFEAGELSRIIAEGERSIAEHGLLDGNEALQAQRQRRCNKERNE